MAILLVLLFHAGVPGLDGGFVGVDVFFVISGFLITGLLLDERNDKGRIDLLAFYARRARRIVPAATATLLATLAVSWFVLAPLDLPGIAADAASVGLFAGNVRFATQASDYFTAAAAPSPFLQYWSLGVEEQFYLVWPALLIVAWRIRGDLRSIALASGLVLAASFGAAIVLTDTAAQWAFYLLPTRAWQLALGGILAVTLAHHERLPARIRSVAWWLGLAAIALAALLLGADTPYPGIAALLPTLGAAGVIVASNRSQGFGRLLCARPLRALGRISYSLYLIHWPILTLPAAGLAIGMELPLGQRIALAVVSIALAWASWRWIEQPFRHGRFAMPAPRVLAMAGATAVLVLAMSGGVAFHAQWVLGGGDSDSASDSMLASERTGNNLSGTDDTSAPLGITGGEDGPVVADTPPPDLVRELSEFGPSDSDADAPTPTSSPTPRPASAILPTRLPSNVRPALFDARDDKERLLHDGCEVGYAGITPPTCIYGDRHGAITIALVGDSHAAQWFPAFDALATQHHWRLLPFVKLSCRFFDLPMYSRVMKREYTECAAWRTRVVDRLQQLRPDLVVVGLARSPEMLSDEANDPRPQGLGLARLLRRIGAPSAILVDTPQSYYDVPACISANARALRNCETPRSAAFGWRYRILERTAAAASGASIVDLSAQVCPRNPCPVVVGDMIVYRDSHHLTATFAASLAPALYRALPPLQPR